MTDITRQLLREKNIYIYDAIDIIKDFYGEDYVDDSRIYKITDNEAKLDVDTIIDIINYKSSDLFVLIHFPIITVTNEFGKSIDIYNVYIKVVLRISGAYRRFCIAKSTFTKEQVISKYIHSHCPSKDDNTIFYNMCLGTGSFFKFITDFSLSHYNENKWRLFCAFLKQYLEVESLQGGPYIRLESVGISQNYVCTIEDYVKSHYCYAYELQALNDSNITVNIPINHFIQYVANRNVLSYNYIINHYELAYTFTEFALKISDLFLDFINEKGLKPKKNIFINVFYNNESLYMNSEITIPDNFEGKYLFTFKNKKIYTEILHNRQFNVIPMKIILIEYIATIYRNLMLYVNKYYGTKNAIGR